MPVYTGGKLLGQMSASKQRSLQVCYVIRAHWNLEKFDQLSVIPVNYAEIDLSLSDN